MEGFRVNDRFYLPWDPLQLSIKIDSGLRVEKHSVILSFYRLRNKKFLWTPLRDRNLLFVTENKNEIVKAVERTASDTLKFFPDSVRTSFFDFTGEWKTLLLPVDDKFYSFTYHPFTESAAFFIDSLIEHCELIKKQSNIEPPNKVLQIVYAHFSVDDVNTINSDAELFNKLKTLLLKSFKQRVYLFFVFERADMLPVRFLTMFSQMFFLGSDNMDYISERVFPTWDIAKNNIFQRLDGLGIINGERKFMPLYPLENVRSEWWKKKREELSEEEKLYREFLDSLDDGS